MSKEALEARIQAILSERDFGGRYLHDRQIQEIAAAIAEALEGPK